MRKKLLLFAAFLLLPAALFATDSAHYFDVAFSSSGKPIAGASIRVCTEPATTTPCTPLAVIYSNSELTTPVANPFVSDALGNYEFYTASGEYAIEVSASGYTTVVRHVTLHATVVPVATGGTGTTTSTGTGSVVLSTGPSLSAKVLNNIRFADQFPGATAGAKIAAAIADLPSTGGTVNVLGLQGAQTISSNFGAGLTKPVHLIFGDTTFTVTNNTVITLPSGSTVSATAGHTLFNKAGTGQVFTFTGAVTATATNLTAIVASGAQALTVASTTGFAVDDWVMINDSSSDAGGGTHSELAQVRTVPDGVTLTLKAGTVNAYTTNKSAAFTASVVKMNVVKDVAVSGVTIDRTGSPADLTGGGGMTCTYAVNCRFTQNTVRNFDTNGIVFSYSYRGIAQDNWIGNAFGDLDAGGHGWAVQVAQSHFMDISHNFFTQIKELAWSGDSSHVSFNNNLVHGMRYGPNIHVNHGNNAHFQNNQFVGETTNAATTDPQVYGGIIQINEPSGQTIISGNSAKNFFGPFIKVTNTTDQSRTIITSNLGQGMRACQGGYGAYIVASGPGITISGNQVYDPPAGCRGIGLTGATGFVLSNNLVIQGVPLVAADVGMEIEDSKYGTVVGNVIEGFSEAGNIGLWIRSTNPGDTDQLAIGLNTLRNNTEPIRVDANATNVGVHVVTFSATPTFDASLGNTQKITLTDNVTSSTLSNATTGQQLDFLICQDGTGSRTFVWPTNVKGGMTIGATLSTCSAQNFIFDGTNAYALSAGVTNM
jgi:hypothetical protein